MPLEDKQLRRQCEREIAKYPLDVSRLNVRALNNICYLEGRIRIIRGAAGATGASLDKVLESVRTAIEQIPRIREVVMSQLQRDY
jgi:hypothetical protein